MSSGSPFAEASLNDSTSRDVDWTRTWKRTRLAPGSRSERVIGQPHPHGHGHCSRPRESPSQQRSSDSSEFGGRFLSAGDDQWSRSQHSRHAGVDALDLFNSYEVSPPVVA